MPLPFFACPFASSGLMAVDQQKWKISRIVSYKSVLICKMRMQYQEHHEVGAQQFHFQQSHGAHLLVLDRTKGKIQLVCNFLVLQSFNEAHAHDLPALGWQA